MSFYKLSFVSFPSANWITAANASSTAPKVVQRLLNGDEVVIVSDRQIDAIVEWDRAIAKDANVIDSSGFPVGQLEYWPTDIKH